MSLQYIKNLNLNNKMCSSDWKQVDIFHRKCQKMSDKRKLLQSFSKSATFLAGKTFHTKFFNENRSINSRFSQGKAI